MVYYQSRPSSPFSLTLLRSQLPHGQLVVDLGADCSPERHCHQNSYDCIVLSNILSICWESLSSVRHFPDLFWIESRIYFVSLRLDPLPAGMLSFGFCRFCSGRYRSPSTEYLSSPPLLSSISSLPSEYCLLPSILLHYFAPSASYRCFFKSLLPPHWSRKSLVTHGNNGIDVHSFIPHTDEWCAFSNFCCLESAATL